MKSEVYALKSTLALYLRLTGGPSVELCKLLLKLVDYLDTDKDHSADIGGLAGILLLHIGDSVLARSTQLGCETYKLRSTLEWVKGRDCIIDVVDVVIRDINDAVVLIERAKLAQVSEHVS